MRIAVIPARGGSKRIPRKNIRPFGGRPMISWSIDAALASGAFDRVIVSTEDREIAEVARGCGAQTPFVRPAELADDFAGTGDVVKHAIEWYRGQGASIEEICCIYATAPFVKAQWLREAYDKLVSSRASYVFSVTTFPFPVQRGLTLNPAGEVHALHPECYRTRSQDLEPVYHDAGQFYWGRADAFMADVPIFSPAAQAFVLPRHLVQDIDTEEDWLRAEWMFQTMREHDGQ